MKSQEKPKEKATFASSSFFTKPYSRRPFCLNFSFCRNEDLNNSDAFESERKISNPGRNDTIISQHYTSIMKKTESFTEDRPKTHPESQRRLEHISEVQNKSKNCLKKDMVLLKNNQRVIIARIVVKNFGLPNQNSSYPKTQIARLAIETPRESAIQQEICKNLARKLRKSSMGLVIDLSPGDNFSLSAFLREDLFTIGIDERDFELIRMKKLLGFNRNIEFIEARFATLARINADVLFKNFIDQHDFSILNDLSRAKLEIMGKKIKNLVFLIPKSSDVSELAVVFNDFFEINNSEGDSRSILIEVLKSQGEIEGYLVYYGPFTGISRKQELEFVKLYLTQDLASEVLLQQEQILEEILSKLGIANICKLLNFCEETLAFKNESLFEKFLHYAQSFHFISEKEVILSRIDELSRKNVISLDYSGELKDNQLPGKRLVISNEKTTNFSDCDNQESIVGSLMPCTISGEKTLLQGEKPIPDSICSQGGSLGIWHKQVSDYGGSWSEKE